MIEIEEARYGPGGPPQGYYVTVGPVTVYVGKRPGWGWALPVVVLITD